MAGEVCARGMPCVILSHEQEPLQRTRDELAAAHGVEVDAMCLDLADPDVATEIRRQLGDRELDDLRKKLDRSLLGDLDTPDRLRELLEQVGPMLMSRLNGAGETL